MNPEKLAGRIYELQRDAIDFYGGGVHGVRDENCVISAVESSLQACYYISKEELPDPVMLAAQLFEKLIKRHCFVKGNKRTALMTLVHILTKEGFDFVVKKDEGILFCRTFVKQDKSFKFAQEWIIEKL